MVAKTPLENNIIIDDEILPLLEENSGLSINLRILVSPKEAGCLIGQNGSVINNIREETQTKAGISKLNPGSQERILTISGSLDNVADALSRFCRLLAESPANNQFTYSFFPLKRLLQSTLEPGQTSLLRLIVPNSQMGTLIGAKGARIKKIQGDFNVLVIASNSFLPGSNERIVEIQGSVDNIQDALRTIQRCLLEDVSSVGTTFYVPQGSSSQMEQPQKNISTTTISIPNHIVGALIGKNGARISGVRKVSGASIAVSDGTDEVTRLFTIKGDTRAVEKAKSLLLQNVDREMQRRNSGSKTQDDIQAQEEA